MIGTGQCDEPALVLVEKAGIFRQAGLRRALASGIGKLPTVAVSTHPRSSPGSQVPSVGQVRKSAKGSGQGGSQSRLLVLLIRESRAWSIDVPSQNVTHQPDTPATGPSAGNPACSGLSHLTDLPTRQRGYRGTPLARASGSYAAACETSLPG